MPRLAIAALAAFLFASSPARADDTPKSKEKPDAAKPTSRTERKIEGWTGRGDVWLMIAPHQGGVREVQEERPRRQDAALQRQTGQALRTDEPDGVLRGDDRGVFRNERFLPVQPGRVEGFRAGDLRVAHECLGVAAAEGEA